jgi:hypothetical protein
MENNIVPAESHRGTRYRTIVYPLEKERQMESNTSKLSLFITHDADE